MTGEKAMSNIIHLKTKPLDAQSQGIPLKSFQSRGGNLTGQKDSWVRKEISLLRESKGENRVREY